MTLSVTISTQMFEENVGHIMMGSQHKKCAKGITQHFKEVGYVLFRKILQQLVGRSLWGLSRRS